MAPISNKRKFRKSPPPVQKEPETTKTHSKTDKKPTLKGGILKLTPTDKQELTDAETGIWISIPKTVVKGKTNKDCVGELREVIASRKLPGLKASVLCGPNQLVLAFGSKKDRDTSLEKLKKLEFNIWGRNSRPVFKEFGDNSTTNPTVCRVRGVILDTLKSIKKAIKDHFTDHDNDYHSKFHIRTVLQNDISIQQFSIKFDKPPLWSGKQIMIKGQKRQVSVESPNKCSLCKELGHSGWECRRITNKTLSEEVTQGTARGRRVEKTSVEESVLVVEEDAQMSTGE